MIFAKDLTEAPLILQIALLLPQKPETEVVRLNEPLLPPSDWLREMVSFPSLAPSASKFDTCEFGTPKIYVCFECGNTQNARLGAMAELAQAGRVVPCPTCPAKTRIPKPSDTRIGMDMIGKSAVKLKRSLFSRLWELLGGRCQRRVLRRYNKQGTEVALFPVPPYNILCPTVRLPLKKDVSTWEVMQAFRPPCPYFWNATTGYVDVDSGNMVPVPVCNVWTTDLLLCNDFIMRCPHVVTGNQSSALRLLAAESMESVVCAQQTTKLHLASLLWKASPLSPCSWGLLVIHFLVWAIAAFAAHQTRKRVLGKYSCDQIVYVDSRISNVINAVTLVIGLLVAFEDDPFNLVLLLSAGMTSVSAGLLFTI